MGRLPKRKRDKIKQMIEEDYTNREICDEVGVSEATVTRFRKKVKEEKALAEGGPPSDRNGSVGKVVHELCEAYFTMLGNIYLCAGSPEVLSEFADENARNLLMRIAQVDQATADHLISGKPFINVLQKYTHVFNFEIPKEKLGKIQAWQREEWVKLLKKHYPSKLAELM